MGARAAGPCGLSHFSGPYAFALARAHCDPSAVFGGLVGCLAGDLASGFHDVVDGLRHALPVLRSFSPAAVLALNLSKTVLIRCTMLSCMVSCGRCAGLRITDHAEYVGILIGLSSLALVWDAPTAKHRSRNRSVRSLLACQVFAFSVLCRGGCLRIAHAGAVS